MTHKYASYQGQGLIFDDPYWERIARKEFPEEWAAIDAQREADAQRARDAASVDPYLQATGEFLEYVCGRPLPNPLTGCTV
jgi:hypothetical protein